MLHDAIALAIDILSLGLVSSIYSRLDYVYLKAEYKWTASYQCRGTICIPVAADVDMIWVDIYRNGCVLGEISHSLWHVLAISDKMAYWYQIFITE